MNITCENCKSIYEAISQKKPNRFGEWSFLNPDQESATLVKYFRGNQVDEAYGHYRVRHAQFGPFTEGEKFQLMHIRDLNEEIKNSWQIGLLCQVLANIKI